MTLNDLERHGIMAVILCYFTVIQGPITSLKLDLYVCDKISGKNDLFSGYNMILAIFPEITEEEGPLHQREFDLCNIARPSQQ